MPLTEAQLEHAREVIRAYRRDAESLIRALELEWRIPRADMLGARRRALRRRGTFDAGRGHYAFHGVGIRLARGRFSMEIEFGPDGRVDGVDAWRLYWLRPDDEPLIDLDTARQALDELTRRGELVHPRWLPSANLYYDAGVTAERCHEDPP